MKPALAKSQASACSGPMVLVGEDDPNTRDLLLRQLSAAGWTVETAANGRLGLEKLESAPALILLDLMMPEMDGFEFLARLRARPEDNRIPVMVLTSKDLTPEDRRRLNGGVDRILQKGSYSLDQLVAEIQRLLPRQP